MINNYITMANFLKVLIKIVDFLALLLPFLSKVSKEEEKKKKIDEEYSDKFDKVE